MNELQLKEDTVKNKPKTYTIGQLASEFNVTPRALRVYEQKGLLSPERVGLSRYFSRRDQSFFN